SARPIPSGRNPGRARCSQDPQVTRGHTLCRASPASRTDLRDKVRAAQATSRNCERKLQTRPAIVLQTRGELLQRVFGQLIQQEAVLQSQSPLLARAHTSPNRELTPE